MKNDEKTQTIKNPSRRKYIFVAGIVFLLIASALVLSLFQQEAKPDPASETLIRQLAARELETEWGLEKDPNELTDEDFAGMKFLEIGGIHHTYVDTGNRVDIKELKDIKFLEKFTGLQSLHMLICFPQKDKPKWMKILAKWNIIDLTKRFTIDLTPLENLNNLESLGLSGLPIKDLKPVSKLVNLRDFSLSDTQVSDLKPLKNLTNLESLTLSGSSISNLEPLRYLSKLRFFDIRDTKVSSFEPLEGLPELKELRIKTLSDLEPLKKLTNLKTLIIINPGISDLKPLRNLTNLEFLNISGSKVSNIEPLEGLKNLKQLYIIDCNNISDEKEEDLRNALPDLAIRRQWWKNI